MIHSVNPPGVWAPFGAFSMAVIQGTGQVVHLKGQVSLDVDGHVVAKGDMRGRRGRRSGTSARSSPPWADGWMTSSRSPTT